MDENLKNLMAGSDMSKLLEGNPAMMGKMNGFWKFLDNL